MPNKVDLTGKNFGTIYVDSPAQSYSGKTYWNCHCIICNKTKIIQGNHLKNGSIKSCGCNHFENKNEENSINKKCIICGKEFQIKDNGQTRKYCYECSPSYIDNKTRSEASTFLRRAMKKEAVKRLGGCCQRCGYNKSIYALSFHHINPEEKDFGLSANGNVHSWENYWKEVQKCELLCANCHAELHEELENQKLKE